MTTKRNFTCVISGKESGTYKGSSPSSAARKVVSKLCSSNKKKNVEFYLREITQGSKKKVYGPYEGRLEKLKEPIELKGRTIHYKPIVGLKKVDGGGLRDKIFTIPGEVFGNSEKITIKKIAKPFWKLGKIAGNEKKGESEYSLIIDEKEVSNAKEKKSDELARYLIEEYFNKFSKPIKLFYEHIPEDKYWRKFREDFDKRAKIFGIDISKTTNNYVKPKIEYIHKQEQVNINKNRIYIDNIKTSNVMLTRKESLYGNVIFEVYINDNLELKTEDASAVKQFIENLSDSLLEEKYKIHILKFLRKNL